MALIKCSECGKEISSKAKNCPHCGATNNKKSQNKHNNHNIFPIIICLLLIFVLIFGAFFAYYIITNKDNEKNVDSNKTEDTVTETYSSFFPYPIINNKEELNKAISNGKVILFIAQSMCEYSKQFSPTVDTFRNNYNLNVYLIMVDKIDFNNLINDGSDFSNFFNTHDDWGTPTLLLYDNGKLINSISGQVSSEELETKLKENNFI